MRLVFRGFFTAFKRGLLSLTAICLCLFLALAAIGAAASQTKSAAKAVEIAVISEEKDAVAVSLIESLVSSQFNGIAKIRLCQTEEQAEGCAAVLTLPNGFWKSLMTGENLSPTLAIKAASPFEGLWIRQLAESAARLLTRAQHTMSGLYAAMKADGLSDFEIDKALFSADMTMLNDYLTRKGRFESVELSATGAINAARYYLSSAAAFISFCMLFMFFTPLKELKLFGRISQSRWRCYAAAFLASTALCALMLLLMLFALGANINAVFSLKTAAAVFFTASQLILLATAAPNLPSAAAICAGLSLVQALFGGIIIPEALLPQALSPLFGVLPLSLMRRLTADIAFGAGFGDFAAMLAWCTAFTALSVLLWQREEARL